ncbi:2',3'-cyclic-nucleotide 2'-phosphodiesterase (5'-nucleotidase family) [Paenibacillus sp. DS2015]|uniref:bifunctional metallophosphatase/5'-nucleotidase n=1 Tax=Paenibacillus sp. DS2015 TaxID=3373917 RepID=UPI003D19F2CE
MALDHNGQLTILHTNDIHSHFETVGSIAALIKREKSMAIEDTVLLLDIGDHMDRMAMETEGSMGQVNTDILNLTGYDAITIGNNEGLTFTPDVLSLAYAGLLCPIVCCNIRNVEGETTPSWMENYTILSKGGITIGITGATAPYDNFYKLIGWRALEPISALEEQIKFLRPQVDVVIVLSHLGLPTDRLLAEQVAGIDLILGGHTHHLLEEPLFVGDTAICATGKFGQYVGKVKMERDQEGLFRVMSGQCIPVDLSLVEETISEALMIHQEQAKTALNQTIAVTDRALPLNMDAQESPFGNVLAQSLRYFTGCKLSMVNTGQLLGSLHEGEITKGLLHRLCPSPINASVLKLKGSDIRYTLEQSLLPEFTEKRIIGYGFRGKVLGSIALDGVEVLYDSRRIPYDRIIEVYVQGERLVDDKDYEVGTIDMFTFRVGYEKIADGHDARYILPELLRDILHMELQRPGSLDEGYESRWIDVSQTS